MIATKESTVRNAVIHLLREAGYSPIYANDLWNRVYSGEYERARPGVKHTWVIGEYEFEFTKQGASQPRTETPFEEIDRRSSSCLNTGLRILALIAIVIAIVIYFL